MQIPKILIVDDDSSVRTSLHRVLSRKGFQVATAADVQEAVELSQGLRPLDLAIIDLRLPSGSGMDLMTRLKSNHPNIQVIMLTGFGSIEVAVEATQKGAFHFMTKPFNIEELNSVVDRAFSQRQLKEENVQLKSQLYDKYKFDNIVGRSPEITKVLELVERVSDTDSTILVTGESGTGKELVARALHFNSPRSDQRLVPVNCGAIPSELLESELFGHIKGAFTGAIANRVGRFELANGGTIFLDEIGEMSPILQIKLLRVLQEREFEPVGSARTVSVDVRVITATNKKLEKLVEEGKFREDLYYRLNVIPIDIPPLRERKSDIPLLLHHFLSSFNQKKGRSLQGFSPDAMDILNEYAWPGNVRELENLMERLAILKGEGIVQLQDLPSPFRKQEANTSAGEVSLPESGLDFNSAVNSYENTLILKALEKTGWNRNQAAQLLRLNRTTLVEKIKKKGLAPTMDV